jgi:phosphatidylglycerophosphatase A
MTAPTCNSWKRCIAFGFGSGLSPYAPGTIGTLVAIPLVWLCSLTGDMGYTLLLVLSIMIGIPVCTAVSQEMGGGDQGAIVWDEVAGFLVTMAFIPLSWSTLLAGFILFRLFDILKPWPIGYLDKKVKGGVGIMLDDLIAGALAWAFLKLLLFSGVL